MERQTGVCRLRRAAAVAGALLSVGLVAGCSGGTSGQSLVAPETGMSHRDSNSTESGSADSSAGDAGTGISAPQDKVPEEPLPPQTVEQRQVIHTAELDLAVDDIAGTTSRIRQLGDGAGGYLAQEDSHREGAVLVVKVPAERLGEVLDQAARLGQVTGRNQRAQDVTDQLVDTQSRIDSQRASVQRLRTLLGQSQSIGEIVQIEGELTSRESQLDSLERRHAALAGQVELATVTVRLTLPPVVTKQGDTGFLAGLAGGWRALTAAGSFTLTALGAAIPFIVSLAIPAGAVVLLWRRRRMLRAQEG